MARPMGRTAAGDLALAPSGTRRTLLAEVGRRGRFAPAEGVTCSPGFEGGVGAEDAEAEEHGEQVGERLVVLLLGDDTAVGQQQDVAQFMGDVATSAIGSAV